MKIGIFGGTFDPVHIGHVRAAEEFAESLALEKVHLVLSSSPPHRTPPSASIADRLAMLRAALDGNPLLAVSDVEAARKGPSYTVDTLRQFTAQAGGRPYLALGSDAFREIAAWHRPADVLRGAHVVVLTRPGTEVDLTGPLPAALRRSYTKVGGILEGPEGETLRPLAVTLIDVSSSRVRDLAREGRSIRYLVPDGVYACIRERGLYPRRPVDP